jgi:hypothetical protein
MPVLAWVAVSSCGVEAGPTVRGAARRLLTSIIDVTIRHRPFRAPRARACLVGSSATHNRTASMGAYLLSTPVSNATDNIRPWKVRSRLPLKARFRGD